MENQEYAGLMETLKRILKERRLRYKHLAKHLGLSESSLKRIFTAEDGSLGRITEICEFLGISFFDLVELSHDEPAPDFRLTIEQEEFFAENISYLNFFTKLYEDKWSCEKIQTEYKLSNKSIFKYLKKLDELDLIELRENNRFSFKVSGTICWIMGGPLQEKHLLEDHLQFLDHVWKNRESKDHHSHSSNFYVSQKTIRETRSALKEVEDDFYKKATRESMIKNPENLIHVRALLAFGPFPKPLAQIENV